MPELLVTLGGRCLCYELRDGKALFAGRTAECDIHLPSPGVSRRHAVFLFKDGECGVKDLDSANGTFLNGKRLSKSVRLRNGDVLRMADITLEFRASSSKDAGAGASRSSRRSRRDAREWPKDAAASPGSPERKNRGADAPPVVEETEQGARGEPEIPVSEETTPSMFTPEPSKPEKKRNARSERGSAKSGAATSAITGKGPTAAEVPVVPSRPRVSLPKLPEIPDAEVGDGGDDAEFVIEDVPAGNDEDTGEAALSKAAAEAGLVGEFVPDIEEEEARGGREGQPLSGAAVAAIEPIVPERPDAKSYALPLSGEFRQAIEARLSLYSFLFELKKEREAIVERRPRLADAVKSELTRQDREIDKIPTADQAEGMIEKRRARQAELARKIEESEKSGGGPPPKPSRDMREAEELAITQWTFISQSLREALPAVYAEAFALAESEPLAECMRRANLDAVPLLGGGVYYFALERLLEEAKVARQEYREKLARLPDPNQKRSGGGMRSMFGLGWKEGGDGGNGNASPAGESHEELVEGEKLMADRAVWINMELAYLEKTLIQEFWRVYAALALFHIPDHENMPLAARAFLRHGAVGFAAWWMGEEAKDHILADCRDEVVHRMEVGRNNTNILYADEYLAAVMNRECTPALDENLEINERNSPNWKADKALRRLIGSRSQKTLMEELLGGLSARIDGLDAEAAAVEEQIGRLFPGSKNFKAMKSELGQKRQAFKVEISKLAKLSAKIRDETLAALKENIAETEERFRSGELPDPSNEFLIGRECEALRKIGRLLANLKERFMPLVLRDNLHVGTDAVNDRLSINGEILEMERRDPAVFLENLVPSKKKSGRVDLRISPVIVLIPSAGVLAYSWNPRGKPEDGRLAIPTCFIRRRIRERQLTYLLADFRWDTSKAAAGMDIMTSDTIVAAFMTVRWDWRKRSKEGREKGLVYTEQNDRTNWRRVYEAYSQTAYEGGKKLFNRNYDFYERIIGKYFDLPEGAPLLKK